MPLWSDMQPLDITSQWCDDWSSASVVNCDLVQDPTIRPPAFGLSRKQRCTLNHFRTNQGHCGACCKLWSLADSNLCRCGANQTMSHLADSNLCRCGATQTMSHLADSNLCRCGATQTMSHIVESCPQTKLNGGLQKLHTAADKSVD